MIENSKVPINALLSQPLASESSTATDPDLSFKRSANGVKFESMKTLNPGQWLLSDVINGFAMNMLRPRVSNRRVHFFSTYFFSRLLDTGPPVTQTPSYKFDEVKRWGDRLSNGILGVRELIIPINHRNVRWLCLKVSMVNKSIMLWDSSGVEESNQDLQGISVDYGLPKNYEGVPPLADSAVKPLKRMRYSHFGCNVIHEDIAYALGVDTHTEHMAFKQAVEVEGGKLPAEHGHGTEYRAPQDTQKRWMNMDPLNVLNPGIGGLSYLPKYGQK